MRSRYQSRQSRSFVAKRRARLFSRWGIGVILAALLVTLISLFSSWGAFTITSVQVAGVDQSAVSGVHDTVMKAIDGSYLGLFSRDNSWLYPRSTIRRDIGLSYPQALSVDVSRTDRHTLVVSIHEKEPAAVVCATLPDFDGDQVSVTDSGACYFTDYSGVMFKPAPSFTGEVYNRYYIPDLARDGEATSSTFIGSYATSTSEFKVIQGIYDAVKRNGIVVDAMLMKGGGEYELYVRNPGAASSTAIIYFNTNSPVNEQVSNLVSFWDYEVTSARAKKERLEFDYIDVRYSPNVYHRFAR